MRLARHGWPGNVRERENVGRWLTVMAPSRTIDTNDLSPDMRPTGGDSGDADWGRNTVTRKLKELDIGPI